MKIIAIIDYEKNDNIFTKTIGRVHPQATLLDLYTGIQKQKKIMKADKIVSIRLDMEM